LSSVPVVSLIEEPSSVSSVDTVNVSNVSSMIVRSIDLEALETIVSDVSVSSSVILDSLSVVSSILSGDNILVDSESISSSVGKDVSSSVELSDSLGSTIEYPPLLSVIWVMVLESQVVLMSTHMLTSVEGSTPVHS